MKMNKTEKIRIHRWVSKNFVPPIKCEICEGKSLAPSGRLEWSNKDHKYSKKREDWQRVCYSCHRNYDVENKLIEYSKKTYGLHKSFVHNCPNSTIPYEWISRVENPKSCPKCKQYLVRKRQIKYGSNFINTTK